MKITNFLQLPSVLVNVIENDGYTGHGKLTATTIISHPHIFALKNKYNEDITTDVVDHFHTLMGKAIHYIFEKAGEEYITEKRYFATIESPRLKKKYEISAQIDIMEIRTRKLTDIKVTSKFGNKAKPEHIAQMNIQDYVMYQNGIEVDSMELLHIYRDWQKKDKYEHMMPDYPMAKILVPKWSTKQQYDYIVDRLVEFENYAGEPCDAETRWAKPDQWALMKPGGSRSRKNCSSEQEAQMNLKAGEIIEYRPGSDVRCQEYCDVNKFCSYYIEKYLCKPISQSKGE